MPKLPAPPPSLEFSKEFFTKLMRSSPPDDYLHWDQLRHRTPPEGWTSLEWWTACKLGRTRTQTKLPLRDVKGNPFTFSVPSRISQLLHEIDFSAGGSGMVPRIVDTPEARDTYRVSQLIEEAITSSQIEGAVTTRVVAKELLRTARKPRDRHERMILNNYHAMRRLGELRKEELSPDLVCEIHRIVTEGTLDDDTAAGNLRKDDSIVIQDMDGIIYHRPPRSLELPDRMNALCDFANQKNRSEEFIHPVVRAILLHFWLAYDHPFVDGNGRTARTLFYWGMLRYGYDLAEFISVSRLILKSRRRYYDSFLYTESDGNDATYFLINQVDVLRQAITDLHGYVDQRMRKIREVEQKLRGIPDLNYRQKAVLAHSLRHPGFQYTIKGHRQSHNVVYATARADLLQLVERGVFRQAKVGKSLVFVATPEMERQLHAVDW